MMLSDLGDAFAVAGKQARHIKLLDIDFKCGQRAHKTSPGMCNNCNSICSTTRGSQTLACHPTDMFIHSLANATTVELVINPPRQLSVLRIQVCCQSLGSFKFMNSPSWLLAIMRCDSCCEIV